MNLILFSIFILICLTFSFIEIFERKSFIILDIILVIFFVLLIANRSVSGTPDTPTYVEDFGSLTTKFLYFPGTVNTTYQFEYGYSLISQIFKMFFGNTIRFFFGFLAFINMMAVILSSYNILKSKNIVRKSFSISRAKIIYFRHKKHILFAPLFSLYASYFGFMYSGIVLRQGLALSILLIAFYFLISRRYVWGLLFLLISFFFHNTAIFSIGILFFVFTDFTFKKRTYNIYLIIAFLLYMFKFFNVLSTMVSNFLFEKFNAGYLFLTSDKISTYLGHSSGNLSKYSLSIIANFIFSFIAIKLIDNSDKFQHKLLQINIFAMSVISFIAGIQALTRAIDYYSIFNLLLFYIILFNKKITIPKLALFSLIVISNSIIFYRLIVL